MQLPQLNYHALTAESNSVIFKNGRHWEGVIAAIFGVWLIGTALSVFAFHSLPLGIAITVVSLIAVTPVTLKYSKNLEQQEQILQNFVADNKLEFVTKVDNPGYPGILFQTGHSRKIKQALRVPTSTQPIEVGNYTYSTGSGKHETSYNLGYIHIKLPRRLPHMLLDSKANSKFTAQNFTNDQKLSLEGDFNNYFTLYAPQQYKRDALYVFTPDVMLALVDHARDFDVEIVDDNLYIYSKDCFEFLDAGTWQKLMGLVSVIGPEFTAQTDYYSDERVGNRAFNQIAAPGHRLKSRTIGIGSMVFIAIFALGYFQPLVSLGASLRSSDLWILVLPMVAATILPLGGVLIFLLVRHLKQR